MQMESDASRDVIARLRRVEGQVGGIIRMLEEQRDCADIVTQVAAASRALHRAGFKLMASGLRQCLAEGQDGGNDVMSVEAMEKLFLSLA